MRLIVGVSGASGAAMGRMLLTELKKAGHETFLVVTDGGRLTYEQETGRSADELKALADHVFSPGEIGAVIASGSFVTDGMIVMPCSMKTLAGIVNGYADNLLLRAADVCLKEGRKLVLVPREMPLGRIHLRNMLSASELGCAIVPPMLTFYNGAETLDDQVRHVVGKVLMQFGISVEGFRAWKGTNA